MRVTGATQGPTPDVGDLAKEAVAARGAPACIAVSAAQPSTARAAGCILSFETVTPKACVFGNKDARRSIALFGDSHADHWSTPLIEAAEKNDTKVVTWLKSGCRASRVTVWATKLKRNYTECDQWRAQSIRQIIAARPNLVVISEIALVSLDKMAAGMQAPESQEADGRAGLHATLTAFSQAGLKVAVIRDVPFNDDHVDTCVARALWRGEKPSLCDQKRTEAANDANAAVERNIVRAVPGGSYIDMTSQFCDAKTATSSSTARSPTATSIIWRRRSRRRWSRRWRRRCFRVWWRRRERSASVPVSYRRCIRAKSSTNITKMRVDILQFILR
ncbi:hypothetical protein NKI45_10965 [Mesorhizobium sp. M0619]|uniref:SGNH hydrolase domain-containing protein n=1 Tax=Mesorhizobium sp. M0619 TaxID=2956973 RepID=UPI003339A4CA